MAVGLCVGCGKKREGQMQVTKKGVEFVCNDCSLKEPYNLHFKDQQAVYARKQKVLPKAP